MVIGPTRRGLQCSTATWTTHSMSGKSASRVAGTSSSQAEPAPTSTRPSPATASAMVIIGGLGSLPGTVVAAILIGLSDGIISVFFSPTLAKILATLLVGLVLVFRPQGLFGTRGV